MAFTATQLLGSLGALLCLALPLPGCSKPAEASATPVAAPVPLMPATDGAATGEKQQRVPLAVVELFTSEGCSSCPPADAVLARLAERADASGAQIFPLSFHVDYWNRLGWEDPYSDAAYSDRQRAYAHAWGTSRVYTPQMVVNGRREFVGSNSEQLEHALKVALAVPAQASVALTVKAEPKQRLSVAYRVNADVAVHLHLALVQRQGKEEVTRGENSGRTLIHRNIVRGLHTVGDQSAGTWTFTLPGGLAASDAFVVGYAQSAEGAVVGAAQGRAAL